MVKAQLNLQRLLRLPIVSSVYGLRLAANWNDATFRFYVEGSYGFFLSDLLRDRSQPFCFIDIGANQGLYSILAARNPYCCAVLALEPVPGTAHLLRRNLAINAADQKVAVIEAALSDQTGRAIIKLPMNHSGGATLRQKHTGGELESVEIELIDCQALNSWRCDPNAPIIAKVDVEGQEPTVIQELMKSSHAESIRAIFYECDEAWFDPAEIETLLRQSGFRTFDRIGAGSHYDVLASR